MGREIMCFIDGKNVNKLYSLFWT